MPWQGVIRQCGVGGRKLVGVGRPSIGRRAGSELAAKAATRPFRFVFVAKHNPSSCVSSRALTAGGQATWDGTIADLRVDGKEGMVDCAAAAPDAMVALYQPEQSGSRDAAELADVQRASRDLGTAILA